MPLGKQYIIQLRTILSKLGIDEEQKEEMVYDATGGRSTSIRQMRTIEAIGLIRSLNGKKDTRQDDAANTMRRKIIAICHEMGWQLDGKINMKRVNAFCEQRGHGRKPLNEYTKKELPLLITQFEELRKHYLNKS